MRHTASDNETSFPDATLAVKVKEKFFTDDYLDSLKTPQELLKRSQALKLLLIKGGFKLTKFLCKVKALADELNGNTESNMKENETEGLSDTQGNSSSDEFGLQWDNTSDTLIVSRGTSRNPQTPLTQWSVLRLVASFFDPLGLVAPFTVEARLLLKDIWRLSCQEWNNELPEGIAGKITEWTLYLPKLSDIIISRSFFPTTMG